jgi:hypothetical protein
VFVTFQDVDSTFRKLLNLMESRANTQVKRTDHDSRTIREGRDHASVANTFFIFMSYHATVKVAQARASRLGDLQKMTGPDGSDLAIFRDGQKSMSDAWVKICM